MSSLRISPSTRPRPRRFAPGCRQFDVCVDPARDDRIYLYEVYDDEAAFQAHLASEHFHEFDARVADWIRGKTVTALHRVHPNP